MSGVFSSKRLEARLGGRRRCRALVLVSVLAAALCFVGGARADEFTLYTLWTPEEFQPRIMQAGRVQSIAPAWRDDRKVLVGTDTGGLFLSRDGANTFSHVDGCPAMKVKDVKFVSDAGDVVLATSGTGMTAAEDGGLWRSTDSGATWTKAPEPPAPP